MFESVNGRIAREAQEFENDLQPYRDMALDIFTVQQLEQIDAEAVVNARHVTTANDRYQMSAVSLELAHNRFAVARSLYDCGVSSEGLEAVKSGEMSYSNLRTHTETLFQHAKTITDVATATWSNIDYKASKGDDEFILRTSGESVLPDSTDSPQLIKAGINALDALYVQCYTRYTETMGNALLPNGFKLKLGRDAGNLLHVIENRRASILRATNGNVTGIRNPNILAGVHNEITEGLAAADRLAVWLSAPRLYDESFTLKAPLDERRPQGGRKFDPQTLASSLIRSEIELESKPEQPRHVSTPFMAEDLKIATENNEVEVAPSEEHRREGKKFDPADLGRLQFERKSEPERLRPSRRTFEPKHLEAPRRRKRFDPKDLD